jgi:hypothetical protein
VALQHVIETGERLIGIRGLALHPGRRFSRGISHLLPRVLVVVAVEAEQLPIAAIGGIIVVVVVLVMDRDLAQLLAAKFTAAPGTDPGI